MADDDLPVEPQRQLSPIGLYSHAADVVQRFPQMKGTPQQFKAMLTKQGVKPDELKHSGYDQKFAGKPLVTKQELAQHFNLSVPPLQETTLRDKNPYPHKTPDEWQGAIDRAERAGNWDEQVRLTNAWEAAEGHGGAGATKFHNWTLPGGTNYRETLLHLPPRKAGPGEKSLADEVAPEHVRHLAVPPDTAADADIYRGGHWDTPNVLAHLRMSDRALPGGRKALHLEELQSDWAQEGRKKGFRDSLPTNPLSADEKKQLRSYITARPGELTPQEVAHRHELEIRERPHNDAADKVPHAPYVDSTQKWVDLGLKRLLHEAAKGGYDKVVMTPGEEQAKRYDLSKHVRDLSYEPDAKLLQGRPVSGHRTDAIIHHDVGPEKLPDIVGKEVAQRLLASPRQKVAHLGSGMHHHLPNEELKVGGEGMKAFYDRMLPQALEKLAKKHDPEAKIGTHVLDEPRPDRPARRLPKHTLHSLDITPRMRASILKGQPAYARGGAVPPPPPQDFREPAAPAEPPATGHNQGPVMDPEDGAPVAAPHGGLTFPVAEGEERLQRKAKRIAQGKTPGNPGNPRTIIKAPKAKKGDEQLPDFATGDINFEDWRRRHEKILTPDEIHHASRWYKNIDSIFARYYPDDPELAKKHRNAWLVAQQNISPPGAGNNMLMQQEQINRGDPEATWKAGGMPNPTQAARAVLRDQPIESGVSQKIGDFVDSAEGKQTRSWMNNHPNGGAPFVVDVHTARDTGLVDEQLLNHLTRLGYKVPEGLKRDFGDSIGETPYENRADWGRKLTDHLNKMKWQGRDDWKPHEIQAVGWMGMTKLTRDREDTAESGLERNLRRISTELSPGEGSPWQQKYGAAFDALPEEHKYGLTKKLTNAAMRHAKDLAGIHLQSMVHGTGGWEGTQNPSAVGQALATKQGADIAAHALGYLLNQTEVWHNRVKPMTATPRGFAIDMVEHGDTDHLHDPKNLQDLWEKVQKADKSGLIKGYQPIVTPAGGKKGIRVLIDKGGIGTAAKLNEALKKGGDFDKLVSSLPYDVRAELHEAEITKAKNDWKEHPHGQAYLRGLEQTLGRNPAADLDIARSQLEKELETHLDEAHAKAGTSWRPAEQEVKAKADGGAVGSPEHIIGALKDWLKEERATGGAVHAGAGSGVGRLEKMRRQSGDLSPNQKLLPLAGDPLVEKALALAQDAVHEYRNGGAVEKPPADKQELEKLEAVIARQGDAIDKLTRLLSAPQIVERDENNRIKRIYREVS